MCWIVVYAYCDRTNGAWLCGDEARRGTLEAGKLADMIVLPQDPLTMPADRIPSLVPDETVVGGATVHRR